MSNGDYSSEHGAGQAPDGAGIDMETRVRLRSRNWSDAKIDRSTRQEREAELAKPPNRQARNSSASDGAEQAPDGAGVTHGMRKQLRALGKSDAEIDNSTRQQREAWLAEPLSNRGTARADEPTAGNGSNGSVVNFTIARQEARPLLPRIFIHDAQSTPIALIAEQTAAAIINAGRPVFKRGYVLVEPIWRERRTNDGRFVKQCALVPINTNRMINILSKWVCVYFGKVGRGRNAQLEPIDPPKDMVGVLLDILHWKLLECSGLTNSPTLRADGSLLTAQGLDQATRLFAFWPDDLVLPPMPEQPTRQDAEAGLALLQELIVECAFVSATDRAVALAAMLTVVLRGAFPLAPLFLFHKPKAATGGSYLVKIISTIAMGLEAVPLNASEDPKELPKELSAAACEAKPILNLDNLTFDLESKLLCQMITEGQVDVRPFGRNTETITCDCRAMTVLANGNNITVVGELVRRALTCRLNTRMERPETKVYNGDPLAMIQANRGKYLAAIFNIVRAFLGSGERVAVEPLNGFGPWARFVQQPLVWLGCADPVASQTDARARDPVFTALRQRVAAIKKHFHHLESFTASDVYNKIMADLSNGRPRPEHQDLFDAFSRDGRPLTVASIGRRLSGDEDDVVDGFSIQVVRDWSGESKKYCVINQR